MTAPFARLKLFLLTSTSFCAVPLTLCPNLRSMAFFTALGYSFNEQFTNETAACKVISEDIYAMLLNHLKFKEFTPLAICDATRSTEVLVCLSSESRAQVADVHKVRAAVVARVPDVGPIRAREYGCQEFIGSIRTARLCDRAVR